MSSHRALDITDVGGAGPYIASGDGEKQNQQNWSKKFHGGLSGVVGGPQAGGSDRFEQGVFFLPFAKISKRVGIEPSILSLSMTSKTIPSVFFSIAAVWLVGCDAGTVQGGDGRIYAGGGHFGQSVALDGPQMLVGADDTDEAFVLDKNSGSWTKWADFSPPSGTPSEALFGWSVDLAGDVAVVGAPAFGAAEVSISERITSGRAYIYERVGSSWSQAAELSLPEPEGDVKRSFFGLPVAVSNGRVAVTSQGTSTRPGSQVVEPAAVLIYERSDAGWVETARVEEQDLSPFGRTQGFGTGMDLDGDRLAVGSGGEIVDGTDDAGTVRVFRQSGDEWSLVSTLTAPTPSANDRFGSEVALDGSLLAVSAPNRANSVGGDVGSVLVYRETAGGWAFEAELQPDGLQGLDSYGLALAAQSGPGGDRVAVGATGRDPAGAVFVWARDASGSWALEAELAPEGYGRGTSFGESVALDGDRLVAGSIFMAGGRGGVFEFRRGADGWEQVID